MDPAFETPELPPQPALVTSRRFSPRALVGFIGVAVLTVLGGVVVAQLAEASPTDTCVSEVTKWTRTINDPVFDDSVHADDISWEALGKRAEDGLNETEFALLVELESSDEGLEDLESADDLEEYMTLRASAIKRSCEVTYK